MTTSHTAPQRTTGEAGSVERATVLEVADLEIEYGTPRGPVRSLDSASLTVREGDILAVVGESGSGKSTLGMAAGRLLPSNAVHLGGELRLLGEPVFDIDPKTLRSLRRDALGYIFQNPIAALDPTMRIAKQMALVPARTSDGLTLEQELEQVGLRDARRVLRSYPHQISGGMAQRVSIAIALRRVPQLLVADEPTAAVDATLRAQILELLVERCRATRCSLLLLTHDLHAVAKYSTHIAVMYGGRVVESGPTAAVLSRPMHPYTRVLVTVLPGQEEPGERLEAIAGSPPVLRAASTGCAFAARCSERVDTCLTTRPRFGQTLEQPDRSTCCHLVPTRDADSGGREAQG